MPENDILTVEDRVFADFPEHLAPEGDMSVIKRYENPDFGIGGVDGEKRLVSFSDDGWIVGFHLEGASVTHETWGKRLDAEYEPITDRSMPEEFMHRKDVSDWIWVHPRYRWLVRGIDD